MGTTTALPAPPAGWFDYCYAVLSNGGLALIRSDRDIRTEHRRWRSRMQGGHLDAPPPNFRDLHLRLSRFDGSTEIGATEVPADGWPMADCLADGRWLIVSPRTAADEHNGRLFAADGTPAGTFAMGDGIAHIRCAPDGTIWVAYFDEGIFLASNKDGSAPVSASGVARFGPDGSVLWRFDDEGRSGLSIVDCYALTLDDNTLWCCPCTDFPIVRVHDGVVRHWQNDVTGAHALAVDGEHVLLAGGYNDQADRIALLRLDGERARLVGQWRLPMSDRSTAHLVQGQGATLHIAGQSCACPRYARY